MKAWLEINRTNGVEKREVKPRGHVGEVSGECPGCKAHPFFIQCFSLPKKDDQTLRSGAYCTACNDAVGFAFARVDTLFGLEEDQRVLAGRCRVY